MLPIIDAIRQRILSRSQARSMIFHTRRPAPPLKYSQSGEQRKLGSFEAGSGFGLEWADSQRRSFAPAPQGVARPSVPRPTVNRGGSTSGLKPARIMGPSEIQETKHGKLSYRGTDQRPTVSRRSSGAAWDGVVRAHQGKSKGFEGVRGKTEPTPGDIHAEELKKEPYSFF